MFNEKEYRKEYYLKNKEKIRKYQKEYQLENKENHNKYKREKYKNDFEYRENVKKWHKKYYDKNRIDIITRQIEYRKNNKEKNSFNSRKYLFKIKLLVLSNYSKFDIPKCECCNDDNIEFLNIDHINGGGNRHRKNNNIKSSTSFYRWLIKNNFPDGFRVLCFNCNCAIGMFGYCPHGDKRKHEEYISLLKS